MRRREKRNQLMTRSDQEPGGARQIGALCRWDGARWEPLTGPEAEEAGSKAFLALYDLIIALGILDGKKGAHDSLSDQAEWWHHALDQVEDAYNRLGSLMEYWGDAIYDAQISDHHAS